MSEFEKTCCFFGHRYVSDDIKPGLIEAVTDLIKNHGVTNFYVGHQGQFDSLVYSTLKELAADFPEINYAVALAYFPEKKLAFDEKNTIIPDGLENVPKRFGISRRNDWLIEKSQYVICYVCHTASGARTFAEKAVKKGRTVINLANDYTIQ